jgi:hypothetical protein
MLRRANLETLALSETSAAGDDQPTRRTLLLTTLLASLPLALRTTAANAGVINPSETTVTLADAIHFLLVSLNSRTERKQRLKSGPFGTCAVR